MLDLLYGFNGLDLLALAAIVGSIVMWLILESPTYAEVAQEYDETPVIPSRPHLYVVPDPVEDVYDYQAVLAAEHRKGA